MCNDSSNKLNSSAAIFSSVRTRNIPKSWLAKNGRTDKHSLRYYYGTIGHNMTRPAEDNHSGAKDDEEGAGPESDGDDEMIPRRVTSLSWLAGW